MKNCRDGDQGGMRKLLDKIAKALLDKAVTQYLELFVVREVMLLKYEDSVKLAKRYVETFNVLPGLELEPPAFIAMRWRQIIHQHAHQVLYG